MKIFFVSVLSAAFAFLCGVSPINILIFLFLAGLFRSCEIIFDYIKERADKHTVTLRQMQDRMYELNDELLASLTHTREMTQSKLDKLQDSIEKGREANKKNFALLEGTIVNRLSHLHEDLDALHSTIHQLADTGRAFENMRAATELENLNTIAEMAGEYVILNSPSVNTTLHGPTRRAKK